MPADLLMTNTFILIYIHTVMHADMIFKCASLYKNDPLHPLFPALQIKRKASFLQKSIQSIYLTT